MSRLGDLKVSVFVEFHPKLALGLAWLVLFAIVMTGWAIGYWANELVEWLESWVPTWAWITLLLFVISGFCAFGIIYHMKIQEAKE